MAEAVGGWAMVVRAVDGRAAAMEEVREVVMAVAMVVAATAEATAVATAEKIRSNARKSRNTAMRRLVLLGGFMLRETCMSHASANARVPN